MRLLRWFTRGDRSGEQPATADEVYVLIGTALEHPDPGERAAATNRLRELIRHGAFGGNAPQVLVWGLGFVITQGVQHLGGNVPAYAFYRKAQDYLALPWGPAGTRILELKSLVEAVCPPK